MSLLASNELTLNLCLQFKLSSNIPYAEDKQDRSRKQRANAGPISLNLEDS